MSNFIRIFCFSMLILIFNLNLNYSYSDSNRPIIIPTHNWSSQVVGAYVIGGIFEAMGNRVEYVPADSQAVYESVRLGDVSISHEVWQSAFGKSFDNARSRGGLIDAGEHAAFTFEELGVPTWVIEKNLCPGLPDWEALKDCAHVFARPGSKGKGVILDGPQSWHQDLFPQRIEALGLSNKYVVKFARGADALWAELQDAKRNNRGTIIFNWTPNWTDAEGFTMIKWPPYYNGCRPNDGGSGACGSPTGYLKKAASEKFARTHPNAFRAFQKFSFTTKDMGRMAAYVDKEKMTHEDAARKWLRKNKHKWEYWIGRTDVAYNAIEQQKIDEDSFYTTTTKIVKKNNKVVEIDKMYLDGYLTKSECEKLKSTVLKVTNSIGICDDVKIKVAEKPKKKKTRKKIAKIPRGYCESPGGWIPCPKKKKIVEIAEATQEEFKPDITAIDNDPPVITIAQNIKVNDTDYEVEGNVQDKSEKVFLEVEGRPVKVKNGKFIIRRYSPVDEQIKIVAIDQWGNRSKPKLVNITIDIQETIVVEKLEPLNPTILKNKSSNNRVALILGIENYKKSPNANFANLDAKYFYEYVKKGFGVKKENIKLLIDEDANLIDSISILQKWLPAKIKPNQSELIIFFAGHGLASNDGKELYLLSHDSDPDLLSRTALSRTELFNEIVKLKPKSVTMFLDTCYSGISRDEQMLLASARPIRIVADEQEGIPNNFTIFSASKVEQISSGLKEAKHGIFSYYLMRGLEGKADINKDYKITNGELLVYMDQNVSQKAAELGRQQNPSLAGDPDKVLISY